MYHKPVLAAEVLDYLACGSNRNYIDSTVGTGGHSELILTETAPEGIVVGFERDSATAAIARDRLRKYGGRFRLIENNFSSIGLALQEGGVRNIHGIVFDLGISSLQIDNRLRGFSFKQEGPLDMRMDTKQRLRAHEIVNHFSEKEIADVLKEFGEERFARRIAGALVRRRADGEISNTLELSQIILKAIPEKFRKGKIHPATKSFMALRIFVNDELENLKKALEGCLEILESGARIVVISFHSLEDRIVKRFFREKATGCTCPRELPSCVCKGKPKLKIITGRPVIPGQSEINANPRARSAKLRAAMVL